MADGLLSLQADTALANAAKAPRVRTTTDVAQARRVSEDFESFFLSQMLRPMFNNTSAEEPFGGGSAEKIWRSLQIDEYGKSLARSGGIGIADAVFREILKIQEGA